MVLGVCRRMLPGPADADDAHLGLAVPVGAEPCHVCSRRLEVGDDTLDPACFHGRSAALPHRHVFTVPYGTWISRR